MIIGGWVKERDSIYAFSGGKNPEGGSSLNQQADRRHQLLGQGNAGNAEPGAAPHAADEPSEGDGAQGTLLVGEGTGT